MSAAGAPQRHRRRTLELLTLCAVGLVLWTVLLALTLPSDYHVHQWRTTWVGFDALLVAAMASTAYLGWRKHRGAVIAALATAALLICDAWFDVSLAIGTPDIWISAVLAVVVEVPMAAFLIRRVYALLPAVPARPRPGR
jgi:mannitol-specific phosphotransferase system IIBC component